MANRTCLAASTNIKASLREVNPFYKTGFDRKVGIMEYSKECFVASCQSYRKAFHWISFIFETLGFVIVPTKVIFNGSLLKFNFTAP